MSFFQQFTQSKNFKKIAILGFFSISALIWLILLVYRHYYISTNNAYVNANVVQIAPRVPGKIVQIYVKNNQYVQQGDALFDLDAEPFQLAVNSATAEQALSEAERDKAANTEQRVLDLVKKRFLSPQEGDNAIANYKTAIAKVTQAKARLAQATLNLQDAHVIAPTSGWVTNFTLRTGDMVSANQPLFALISNEEFWVDANFKETEIETIQSGQRVTIVTDMYPHHPFNGIVESISYGAGSVFSLLPPQNATGNWVKVTQRIPVRIRVLQPQAQFPLRIGTSATVTIHLKQYAQHQAP